jgi:hypothetical protein
MGRFVPVKSLFLALFVGRFAAQLRARVAALGGSIGEYARSTAVIDGRGLGRRLEKSNSQDK